MFVLNNLTIAIIRLYAGQYTGPEPNGALCRAQMSLLYGVLPM